MENPNWKKGAKAHYRAFRLIVINQLGVTDRRTIAKWLGKQKVTWRKKRGSPLYPSTNIKVKEWQKGLLEEFGIIEKIEENENIFFKVLKDKTDF